MKAVAQDADGDAGQASTRQGDGSRRDRLAPLDDFALDRGAEVPIGVQLAWAIRARIDDGRLTPGLRLPGLRDLAMALAINANTVRAVYARLEQEGMLESRQGSGTFVAVATTTAARPRASGIAASAAREAIRTGVDPRDVAAVLYVGADRPRSRTDAARPDTESPRRARLRGQIAALEQTLSELEAEYPRLARRASSPEAPSSGVAARLPTASELEQTRLTLVRRLASLQAMIDGLRHDDAGGSGAADERAVDGRAAAQSTRRERLGAPRRRPQGSSRPAPAGT